MNGSDDDAAIERVVAEISAEQWERFERVRADFLADPEPHVLRGDTRGADGVIRGGGWDYSPAVDALVRWMYDSGVILEGFDWPSWEGVARYRSDPRALDDAPLADVLRMATGIVRGDRFHEGALANAIDEGAVAAIVERLHRWRDEHR